MSFSKEKVGDATATQKPEALLERMIISSSNVGDIVFDFFAGTGTTMAAAYKTSRKFIISEMDTHQFFDNEIPRAKRILHGDKYGISEKYNNPQKGIIKYLTLESYEDALSNIQLDDDTHGMLGLFSDDYMIHYMFDLESQGSLLNLDAFRDPLLEEDDNNFVDEYKITYAPQGEWDHTGEDLDRFVSDISAILKEHDGLDEYQKPAFRDRLVLFDFRAHLYAPLLCLQKSNLKIQVTPVSLNEDEKKFVDLLHEYVIGDPKILRDKTLYLLRNKSKTGMGFFEAGNFYPDYILWINSDDTEYISFIDPKGLLNLNPDDPKIQFSKMIKEKEKQLSSQATEKRIVLNSFIISGTNEMALNERWRRPDIPDQKAFREERNIYMLDDDESISKMISKILICS